MGLELNPDERRLLRGLFHHQVVAVAAATVIVAIVVSLLGQPVVGSLIFAGGLIGATNLAVRIVRSQPDR